MQSGVWQGEGVCGKMELKKDLGQLPCPLQAEAKPKLCPMIESSGCRKALLYLDLQHLPLLYFSASTGSLATKLFQPLLGSRTTYSSNSILKGTIRLVSCCPPMVFPLPKVDKCRVIQAFLPLLKSSYSLYYPAVESWGKKLERERERDTCYQSTF